MTHVKQTAVAEASQIIADQECSRKSPDVYFDLPDRVVIVEIDEHQHKIYDEGCSCARMCEIVAAIAIEVAK